MRCSRWQAARRSSQRGIADGARVEVSGSRPAAGARAATAEALRIGESAAGTARIGFAAVVPSRRRVLAVSCGATVRSMRVGHRGLDGGHDFGRGDRDHLVVAGLVGRRFGPRGAQVARATLALEIFEVVRSAVDRAWCVAVARRRSRAAVGGRPRHVDERPPGSDDDRDHVARRAVHRRDWPAEPELIRGRRGVGCWSAQPGDTTYHSGSPAASRSLSMPRRPPRQPADGRRGALAQKPSRRLPRCPRGCADVAERLGAGQPARDWRSLRSAALAWRHSR